MNQLEAIESTFSSLLTKYGEMVSFYTELEAELNLLIIATDEEEDPGVNFDAFIDFRDKISAKTSLLQETTTLLENHLSSPKAIRLIDYQQICEKLTQKIEENDLQKTDL